MKLEGVWWNELGSNMEIEIDPADPKTFRDLYRTNVGNATEKSYPLLGRCDDQGLTSKMVGFVVAWNADRPVQGEAARAPSVTAWCGQLQIVDQEEVITTTWLLDRLTDPKDDWESTLIGMDYFKRTKPRPEEIEFARKHGRASRAF